MKHRPLALVLALGLGFILATDARAQQPSASHVAAVKELFRVMDLAKVTDQSIDVMLTAQIEANPQLKQFEDVMRQFLAKYLSWENLETQMVQMYAEAFTEPEVRELIVFYQTPLGRKMVTRMPELMQKGAALGQSAVQDHLPELQEAIAKKMEESGSNP